MAAPPAIQIESARTKGSGRGRRGSVSDARAGPVIARRVPRSDRRGRRGERRARRPMRKIPAGAVDDVISEATGVLSAFLSGLLGLQRLSTFARLSPTPCAPRTRLAGAAAPLGAPCRKTRHPAHDAVIGGSTICTAIRRAIAARAVVHISLTQIRQGIGNGGERRQGRWVERLDGKTARRNAISAGPASRHEEGLEATWLSRRCRLPAGDVGPSGAGRMAERFRRARAMDEEEKEDAEFL